MYKKLNAHGTPGLVFLYTNFFSLEHIKFPWQSNFDLRLNFALVFTAGEPTICNIIQKTAVKFSFLVFPS